MERIIRDNGKNQPKTICLDKPGAGGACHHYEVIQKFGFSYRVCQVNFQNGPIQENGVNGCQNEDLLAILIDRLRGFQSGDFACRDNAVALTHIETALMWLEKRTKDRS